jgi:hypothetical protein
VSIMLQGAGTSTVRAEHGVGTLWVRPAARAGVSELSRLSRRKPEEKGLAALAGCWAGSTAGIQPRPATASNGARMTPHRLASRDRPPKNRHAELDDRIDDETEEGIR